MLLKLSQNIEEKETLPTSFYKVNFTSILKPDKRPQEKYKIKQKLKTKIPDKYRCKNSQKNIIKWN